MWKKLSAKLSPPKSVCILTSRTLWTNNNCEVNLGKKRILSLAIRRKVVATSGRTHRQLNDTSCLATIFVGLKSRMPSLSDRTYGASYHSYHSFVWGEFCCSFSWKAKGILERSELWRREILVRKIRGAWKGQIRDSQLTCHSSKSMIGQD